MDNWSRRKALAAVATGSSFVFSGCTRAVESGTTYQESRDWPMHTHDTTNSFSNSRSSGPKRRPTVSWSADVTSNRRYGHAYPIPVVSEGSVFVGGDGLYEFRLRDGRKIRRSFTNEAVYGPAVVDGTVHFASSPTDDSLLVRAFDRISWKREWKQELALDRPRARPLLASGKQVYVPVGHGNSRDAPPEEQRLVILRREDGSIAWNLNLNGSSYTPVPAVDGGSVYTDGDKRGQMQAIGPQCGPACQLGDRPPATKWAAGASVAATTAPAITDDAVYVTDQFAVPPSRGGQPGFLYALRRSDGALRWREKLGFHVSSPARAEDNLYVVAMHDNGRESGDYYGTDVRVRSYNEDGTRLWSSDLSGRRAWGAPVYADGVLYVGTFPSQLVDSPPAVHAYDAADGTMLWEKDIATSPCSLVVADGTLLLSGWEGKLVALS